jgi:hypothetical protein
LGPSWPRFFGQAVERSPFERRHVLGSGISPAFPLKRGLLGSPFYYKVAPTDVAAGTVMKVEFEDPLVKTHYNPKLKPGDADANSILAIQFMIPTTQPAPRRLGLGHDHRIVAARGVHVRAQTLT